MLPSKTGTTVSTMGKMLSRPNKKARPIPVSKEMIELTLG